MQPSRRDTPINIGGPLASYLYAKSGPRPASMTPIALHNHVYSSLSAPVNSHSETLSRIQTKGSRSCLENRQKSSVRLQETHFLSPGVSSFASLLSSPSWTLPVSTSTRFLRFGITAIAMPQSLSDFFSSLSMVGLIVSILSLSLNVEGSSSCSM